MSDKRIYELLNSNTLSAGDKLAIDKNSFSEAKSIDASLILTPISDLESEKVPKSDLTNISITGTKNNTGSTITSGTFFYKDGTLVKAKTDIANNATLTLNTNYEIVTAGGLNALNEALNKHGFGTAITLTNHVDYTTTSDGYLEVRSGTYTADSYSTVYVNGQFMGRANPNGIAAGIFGIFIKKGMTIKYDCDNGSPKGTFYPLI